MSVWADSESQTERMLVVTGQCDCDFNPAHALSVSDSFTAGNITRITPSDDKWDCCLQCESLPYRHDVGAGKWTPNCHGAVFVSPAAANFLQELRRMQPDGCADPDTPCNCVLLDKEDSQAQNDRPGGADSDMTYCRPLPSGMLTMRGELDLMVVSAPQPNPQNSHPILT